MGRQASAHGCANEKGKPVLRRGRKEPRGLWLGAIGAVEQQRRSYKSPPLGEGRGCGYNLTSNIATRGKCFTHLLACFMPMRVGEVRAMN
jgi:hypothetical protein